jgi:hypothetical protein
MVSGFFAIVTALTVIGAVAGTAGFVFGEGAFIDGLYRATTGGC